MPNAGLELLTLRSRVARSAEPARRPRGENSATPLGSPRRHLSSRAPPVVPAASLHPGSSQRPDGPVEGARGPGVGGVCPEAAPGPRCPGPAHLGPAAASSAAPAAAGAAAPTSSSAGTRVVPVPPPCPGRPRPLPQDPGFCLHTSSPQPCPAGVTGGLSPWLFGSETRPGPHAR